MSTRNARLDEVVERTLERAQRKPCVIFHQLDLGIGGDALAPARDAKSAIVEVIRRKHSQ